MKKNKGGGGYTLYERMLAESKRLEKEIIKLTKQIDALPKGKISISHTGKYTKWYHIVDKAKCIISKNNRKLANALAAKKYFIYMREDLEQEKCAIDFYLRHHKMEKKADILYQKKEYTELIAPFFKPTSKELLQWMNFPYEKNTTHLEQIVHKTISGNMVRSKSEAMIDMFLFKNKVPFRYECALKFGEIVLFPDFTIRHPKTGAIYYWEHFGLMDHPQYTKNAYAKLQLYTDHKIVPGIQLITTFETKETPLSADLVEKIVTYYFL